VKLNRCQKELLASVKNGTEAICYVRVQKCESFFFFFFFFLALVISLIVPRAYCCCAPTIHATTGLLLRLPCTTTLHRWVSFPANAATIHGVVVHDADLR